MMILTLVFLPPVYLFMSLFAYSDSWERKRKQERAKERASERKNERAMVAVDAWYILSLSLVMGVIESLERHK